MATVLVTGGTGTFGRHAARLLAERGHAVRVFSLRNGGEVPAGTDGVWGNLATGEGLADAVAGVEWILHAASDAYKNRGAADVEATRRLLDAAPEMLQHMVYVSIVGVDRIPYRYYRNKLACERLVEQGRVPFTIFRATQFHEFAESMLRRLERFVIAPAPLGIKAQLVAAAEAAEAAVHALEAQPAQGHIEFGGPEVLSGREILATWREQRRRPRAVVPLPLIGRVWAGFKAGWNTTPGHAGGRQTWRDYVAAIE